MGKKSEKIFFIDGNSFCYRAFYAIQDLATSKGMPTNAIYGVINMLNKLIKENSPEMLAVVFDLKGPTKRHEKFAEYKIQRKPMPESLVDQMPRIKEIIAANRIKMYEKQGYEADDIIATLAEKAKKEGYQVVIVSADKDALQLVDDDITVLSPHIKESKSYNADEVLKKYGVLPGAMIDLMALMGDASDNVPGVEGIGQVTAQKLISEYGTIEKLYENFEKIKSDNVRGKLERGRDMAFLSKELVTLYWDVPVELDIDAMRASSPDTEKLAELYREFEFRTLLKELNAALPVKITVHEECEYFFVSEKEVPSILNKIKKLKDIAFSLDITDGEIKGVAFSWEKGKSWYISVLGAAEELKDILSGEKSLKIGYDIKSDMILLKKSGYDIGGKLFDVMISDYLLEPAVNGRDLENMAARCLEYTFICDKGDVLWDDKGQATLDFSQKKSDDHKKFCERADVIYRLYLSHQDEMTKKQLDQLFNDVEMPLVPVLAVMEEEGIGIDTVYVGKMSEKVQKEIETISGKIYESAGGEFNINSPKQLQHILFDKMNLQPGKKTKTGVSTDESVLLKLAQKHELPAMILEYRALNKLKTTYYEPILDMTDKKTSRLHTHFNQAVTATGRLSSSEPNLQNIPIRTERGKEIRRAFVPGGKKRVLIAADYSQIELRVLAHLSGDRNLSKAFENSEDVHKYTASLIFNVPIDAVTDEMRGMAKTVNFGIVYGMGAFRLAKDLGISMSEAENFIKSYFERYEGVKNFIDDTLDFCRANGYVVTLLNRRRFISEINSTNQNIKGFAERAAINTPVQGSAADLIKLAMLRCHEVFKNTDTKMLLQVHDELIFDVPVSDKKEVGEKIKRTMESVMELKVPLKVDVECGSNWLDMEDLG
ncbi:MAG TPA: DNA polymerase I [Candidatus Omnitrophota bacterium]|nr:DNA polymerase I [Candidatus Omnitrophota bacterium]HPS19935.1 DNA polymerase I [Candidatus Omnitrophota bacterium]